MTMTIDCQNRMTEFQTLDKMLPYNRRRLIELHEQLWLPPFIRRPVQDLLTIVWCLRLPLIQSVSPAEAVEQTLAAVQMLDSGNMRIVDCCSGAGGPLPAIEKSLNRKRTARSLKPIPFLLSDIQPHIPAWQNHAASSKSLDFLPYPVDATRAPREMTTQRHFRTFCLAFHHFDEEGAVRVLEDAMRTADGIGIFELQTPDIGSLIIITLLFPLSLLLVPFHRPNALTLLFTYLIPIIPLILVFDGYVSAWRTRSYAHINHLAEVALHRVNGEREERGQVALEPWSWKKGRRQHTWPFGYMTWVVGTRKEKLGRKSADGPISLGPAIAGPRRKDHERNLARQDTDPAKIVTERYSASSRIKGHDSA